MSFSPIPDVYARALPDLTLEFLRRRGITLLMLDLDNTIAPYGATAPASEILAWADRLKDGGVTLFIVSNSRKTARVSSFAAQLGCGFVHHARKPSPKALRAVMRDYDAANCAFVGDQTYTDVLGANRAGVLSIAVHPLKWTNPLLLARYWLELPFRAMTKERLK
ncbi:MAG: YqeG family HAD IIIA-type phosphatase [Oscillospiraceae bacterium]|jgi:HAD superfamily phosphatase (TIGR01668 family)|nr:YqeG family HAD IIIA-type phosphatase [Oscillospiraceae bacterium]